MNQFRPKRQLSQEVIYLYNDRFRLEGFLVYHDSLVIIDFEPVSPEG